MTTKSMEELYDFAITSYSKNKYVTDPFPIAVESTLDGYSGQYHHTVLKQAKTVFLPYDSADIPEGDRVAKNQDFLDLGAIELRLKPGEPREAIQNARKLLIAAITLGKEEDKEFALVILEQAYLFAANYFKDVNDLPTKAARTEQQVENMLEQDVAQAVFIAGLINNEAKPEFAGLEAVRGRGLKKGGTPILPA